MPTGAATLHMVPTPRPTSRLRSVMVELHQVHCSGPLVSNHIKQGGKSYFTVTVTRLDYTMLYAGSARRLPERPLIASTAAQTTRAAL